MILGMVGFIGSGKGSVGDILQSEYGFVQDSFASPLKDAVSKIFGWDRQMLEGATKESREWRELPDPFWSEKFGYSFTPRLALQLMGTEAGRDVFHKDIWVISLLHRNQGKNVVITDVRFKNEIDLVKKNGGKIIRVIRGQEPTWYETAKSANYGNSQASEDMKALGIHLSEWDWVGQQMDYTIHNNGTLEDLTQQVRAMTILLS